MKRKLTDMALPPLELKATKSGKEISNHESIESQGIMARGKANVRRNRKVLTGGENNSFSKSRG